MKNKLHSSVLITTILLLVVGFSSCDVRVVKPKKEGPPKDGYFEYDGGMWSSMEYKIEELTIDSCQYIIIFGSEGRNIIHKANCRNVIHTCR